MKRSKVGTLMRLVTSRVDDRAGMHHRKFVVANEAIAVLGLALCGRCVLHYPYGSAVKNERTMVNQKMD